MSISTAEPIPIETGAGKVGGLWLSPAAPHACLVLAPGAGAGIRHAFLEAVTSGLYSRGVATLRYQFPYMDQGSRRPDPPKVCHATVRAAVLAARARTHAPILAGGRSFGGRMTSQAASAGLLPELRGIVFLGFPLHPANKPSIERARHLAAVEVSLLFIQGTRDALAELALLREVVANLGPKATLRLFEDADHSFHVRKSCGLTDTQVQSSIIDTVATWIDRVL